MGMDMEVLRGWRSGVLAGSGGRSFWVLWEYRGQGHYSQLVHGDCGRVELTRPEDGLHRSGGRSSSGSNNSSHATDPDQQHSSTTGARKQARRRRRFFRPGEEMVKEEWLLEVGQWCV